MFGLLGLWQNDWKRTQSQDFINRRCRNACGLCDSLRLIFAAIIMAWPWQNSKSEEISFHDKYILLYPLSTGDIRCPMTCYWKHGTKKALKTSQTAPRDKKINQIWRMSSPTSIRVCLSVKKNQNVNATHIPPSCLRFRCFTLYIYIYIDIRRPRGLRYWHYWNSYQRKQSSPLRS